MLEPRVTKLHFPKCNINNLLEFVFEKDPIRCLRKNSIIIQGAIEVDEKYIVVSGWVSKLFSRLKVEVDSQLVTKMSNK